MSFSCMPNMGRVIISHNKNINSPPIDVPPCKCTAQECPVNGQCERTNVIYQCTVKESTSGCSETYVGLTCNSLKDIITKHRKSFRDRTYHRNSLSKYIWKLKDENRQFEIAWKILDQALSYSPASKICNLCLRECYYIIFKRNLASLNRRDKFFGFCLHKNRFLMENQ